MKLATSTVKQEGVYQGSKWIKFPVLCEPEELVFLCEALEPFSIFPLTGIVSGHPISSAQFIEGYGRWIEQLRQGSVPSDAELRKLLACAFVDDERSLWLQEIPQKGYLVKIAKPVIQVQAHYFTYSKEDSAFRSMSMGLPSIFWGLLFSFPQIYQDPKTMEVKAVDNKNRLFETLKHWVRQATRPTPFLVEGKRINSPIRVGKQTMSWVASHPQLIEQNIRVYHGS